MGVGEYERQIEFLYITKQLKTHGLKLNFDTLEAYCITCRDTGLHVRAYNSLEGVQGFLDGIEHAEREARG